MLRLARCATSRETQRIDRRRTFAEGGHLVGRQAAPAPLGGHQLVFLQVIAQEVVLERNQVLVFVKRPLGKVRSTVELVKRRVDRCGVIGKWDVAQNWCAERYKCLGSQGGKSQQELGAGKAE